MDSDTIKLIARMAELAGGAQVGWSLHCSDDLLDCYVSIESPAPSECYVTKSHSLPVVLQLAIDHLVWIG